jgi:hypothetical protein
MIAVRAHLCLRASAISWFFLLLFQRHVLIHRCRISRRCCPGRRGIVNYALPVGWMPLMRQKRVDRS